MYNELKNHLDIIFKLTIYEKKTHMRIDILIQLPKITLLKNLFLELKILKYNNTYNFLLFEDITSA